MPDNSIRAVSQVVSPKIPDAKDSSGSASLGKEDFLKLLVAQMQQQDPLNPEDPTEFTAQLTQFSQLEQSITSNQKLEDLITQQALATTMGATNFIGRSAEFQGDLLRVKDGLPAAVRFDLPRHADGVTINIYNENGSLVRSQQIPDVDAGIHDFQWDGQDASGNAVANGDYYFEAFATRDGLSEQILTRFTETISGVRFETGQTLLELAGGSEVTLGSVIAVSDLNIE